MGGLPRDLIYKTYDLEKAVPGLNSIASITRLASQDGWGAGAR